MSEVLFYHLERQPLEQVLPQLIEKTLDRGWRAVIEAGSDERVEALSAVLWTWREESFLAHGTPRDGEAALQPVWICCNGETPNNATVRFCVDGAAVDDASAFDRVIYMFNGHDPQAVEHARERWKHHKQTDDVTYWQQNETGRWEKKA